MLRSASIAAPTPIDSQLHLSHDSRPLFHPTADCSRCNISVPFASASTCIPNDPIRFGNRCVTDRPRELEAIRSAVNPYRRSKRVIAITRTVR